jgi:hypothetical protein
MPWPSFPSQSPASDCSYLKAAAECVPADSGAAMDAASSRSNESLRRVTDASSEENGAGRGLTEAGAPRSKGFDAGSTGMEANV